MWRLLALSIWATSCWDLVASANRESGVLPTGGTQDKLPLQGSATKRPQNGARADALPDKQKFYTASAHEKRGGRYGSIRAMHDLLRARQSSDEGLIELQYPIYLSHALLLSNVEATAHDVKRMPLHRFSAPLDPSQIAEVPLDKVGGPRPYHMFVLFTFVEKRTDEIAQRLSSQCKDCAGALAAFRNVSKAYKLTGRFTCEHVRFRIRQVLQPWPQLKTRL